MTDSNPQIIRAKSAVRMAQISRLNNYILERATIPANGQYTKPHFELFSIP